MERTKEHPGKPAVTGGVTHLLANGSSGHWSIDVDESLDGKEWTFQLEGPRTYLVFRLLELDVVRNALAFLESGLRLERGPDCSPPENDFAFGRFGAASVSLRWDNEEGFRRCNIVVGLQPRSTLHLSLYEMDIQMVVAALHEVVQDLSSAN
jgi:hypothetical protein